MFVVRPEVEKQPLGGEPRNLKVLWTQLTMAAISI